MSPGHLLLRSSFFCGFHAEKGTRTNAAPRCDLSTMIGGPFKMATVVKPQGERGGYPPRSPPGPCTLSCICGREPTVPRASSGCWGALLSLPRTCHSNSPSSNRHTLIRVIGCQALLWTQKDKAVLHFTVMHRRLGTFRVVSGAAKGHAGARRLP